MRIKKGCYAFLGPTSNCAYLKMKLRLLIPAVSVVLALQNPASAIDFGPPQKVGEAFNLLAKIMKQPSRMVVRECNGSPPSSCTYGVTGKVSVLVVADKNTSDKTQLIVLGADRRTDPKSFIQASQIAMGAFSKTSDVHEINTAFDMLFAPPIKDRREARISGVKYVLNTMEGGALVLVISDPDITKNLSQ